MKNNITVAFLWVFIALALNFHTQFELREHVFGKKPSAHDAEESSSLVMHIFLLLVIILPLTFGLLTLYTSRRFFIWLTFFYAIAYFLLNLFHLFATITSDITNLSQIILLTLIVFANLLLMNELNRFRTANHSLNS